MEDINLEYSKKNQWEHIDELVRKVTISAGSGIEEPIKRGHYNIICTKVTPGFSKNTGKPLFHMDFIIEEGTYAGRHIKCHYLVEDADVLARKAGVGYPDELRWKKLYVKYEPDVYKCIK